MDPLYIDFESRSPVDLRKAGLWRYTHHPQTDLLCFGFAFGDEDPGIIQVTNGLLKPQSDDVLRRISQHVRDGGPVFAHNAAFEYAIWTDILAPRYGFPELQLEQLYCTMALCYAMGLPGSLEAAAPALGLKDIKDEEGHQLMLRMCKPTNPGRLQTGEDTEPRWVTDEGPFTFLGKKVTPDWAVERLGQYCMTDVTVERDIHRRTVPLSAFERRVWILNERIDRRGVLFDPKSVVAALEIRDEMVRVLDSRIAKLTDGAVAATTNVGAIKEFIADFGVIVDSLAKEKLDDLLTEEDLPEPVRDVLELRREAGRLTSVAKLDSAHRQSDEQGRVHYLTQYHGAHTGRFAGRNLQIHNLTRDLPEPEEVERIMQLIRDGQAELIDMLYGSPISVISRLLRGFIVAAPGHKLIGGDWSSIEGRGIAWLAGEEWKLQAFRDSDADPDGPDIYERSYATTFSVPAENIDAHQRQVGKVLELALGYQGGAGALTQMGNTYGVDMPEADKDKAKHAWRNVHPRVVNYWYDLERAAIRAVQSPGKVFEAGASGRSVKFKKAGSFLWCLLPSRRTLCYPYPLIVQDEDWGAKLTYKTVPSQDDFKQDRLVEDPSNTRQWARLATYGGKLAENITQAVCRDILVEAMLNLEERNYEAVMHVHDEVVVEGAFTERDKEAAEGVMKTPPLWAQDFPLAADCWLSHRYQK